MTRNFLENKLRNVFNDFTDENWCDLDGSKLCVNDYSSIVCQQKYILKYYGAYFCELYGTYKGFLNDYEGDSLKVLSFGCGSGVDCEALNRVVLDLDLDIEIDYVGIDIIDWNYRPDFEWARFIVLNIDEITCDDVKDVDLFIFPKSLTEFSYEERKSVGETIAKFNELDSISFMNTYVTDGGIDNHRVDGINQFDVIHKKMISNDWQCLSSPMEYFYKTNQGWLGFNFSFFKVPDEIKPFVEDLKNHCDSYDEEICENCNIDFIPIMNSRYLAWNTLTYEKSENNL